MLLHPSEDFDNIPTLAYHMEVCCSSFILECSCHHYRFCLRKVSACQSLWLQIRLCNNKTKVARFILSHLPRALLLLYSLLRTPGLLWSLRVFREFSPPFYWPHLDSVSKGICIQKAVNHCRNQESSLLPPSLFAAVFVAVTGTTWGVIYSF